MAALGLAAAAGDTVLVIGGTLTVSSFPAQYTIESEQIAIIGGSAPRWSVQRGLNGSAKAAHAAGTALTAGWGGGGGGGGVTVEVPPAAPVAVTNINNAAATISGSTATIGTAIISPTDPGAIGGGNLWLDSAAGTGQVYPLFVRDPTNAFWLQASMGDKLTTDGVPSLQVSVVDGDSNTIADIDLSATSAGIEVDSDGGNRPLSKVRIQPASGVLSHAEVSGTSSIGAYAGTVQVSSGVSAAALLTGTVDPSAGGGVSVGAADTGLYIRLNGAATELWLKTSAPATGWTKVTVP